MSLPRWWRDTITIISPAWVNERGTERPDWGNAAETVVHRCHVQPLAGSESFDTGEAGRRTAVITRWKAFLPPGVALSAHDRVGHQGETYELDGPPRLWPSATGRLTHIEAILQQVEG